MTDVCSKELDNLFLLGFLVSAFLFVLDLYLTGRGMASTPYLELLTALFAGLYAGRVFSINKVAIASFVIFISSWFLDPLLYNFLGWASTGHIRWFYMNMAVAYCLLFGAVVSGEYSKSIVTGKT